jgi:hypothetical protein
MMSQTWTFNPNQLSTWAEARALVKQIDAFRQSTGVNMGGGVLHETTDANSSGIYVPSWNGGPDGFPEPNDSEHERFWLHFRFANGRAGVNVGLILDLLHRYGGNQMYVFMTLNANDLS